jgi:UDP-glucose 4-epimerase
VRQQAELRYGGGMAVLVTGGAGYIGAHMVLNLLDAGEQVVVVDNLTTGFRSAVPAKAKFIVGDVGDYEFMTNLLRAHGIEAIIHFAAKIVVPESVTDPLGYYLNNTVRSRALLAAAVSADVKHIIFSSTAAVYGDPAQSPVPEEASLLPVSPYGTSKLMTEFMLRDTAAAYPLTYVALRYFNVAGADPLGRAGQSTPNATHLIKVAAQAALGMRAGMQIFGTDYPTPDGTCIRDYIHVSDLIAAHAVALRYLREGGASSIYNCGYGRGYSVRQVIDTVQRISGVNFKVDIAARRPGDPATIVAGAERIRKALGWTPQYDDLSTIVAAALAWERKIANNPPF